MKYCRNRFFRHVTKECDAVSWDTIAKATLLALMLLISSPAFATDCWKIKDSDTRALCEARDKAKSGAGACWKITDPDKRALCEGKCWKIGDYDLRVLCESQEDVQGDTEE